MTRSPALIQLFILLALLLSLVGLGAQAQTPPLVFIPSAPSAPPPVTFHPSPVTGAQGVTGTSATGTQGATGTPVVAGTQGTQGVQGVQGIQGIQGVPGSAGTGSDAQVVNVKAFTPPLSALTLLTGQTSAQALASFQPAQGDGIHDDTLALQAAIDDAVAKSANSVAPAYQRFRVFLPAGVYKITAPLTIDRPGGIYSGFDIEGAGTSPQGQMLEGGTTIIQRGAAQDSVLWVKNGSFRNNRIANLTLMVATDTRYGIHLGSQYSRLLISRVEITVPGGIAYPHGTTGIYQEYPSAGQNANGEQTVLDDVQCDYLDTLYDFRSAQAFGLTLRDCGGQPNNGGTALAVGVNDSGGYQVLVTNFSVSAGTGTLPNTLFHIGIISGNFTAISTRSEKFDTLLKLDGGSNGIISNVTLSDSHFDSITQHAAPIVGAAGGSSQYFVTMARNKFSPLTPGSAFTMPAPTDLRHDVWDSCLFEQWSSVSLGARPNAANYPFNGYPGTVIKDCWTSTVAQPILAAVTN